MNKQYRENGYYWVRIKRTKIWIIAKWMQSYQWWVTMNIENDIRGGFDMVDERRIIKSKEPKIKRIRRNKNEDKVPKRTRRNRSRM
jgi:hypothetical protein